MTLRKHLAFAAALLSAAVNLGATSWTQSSVADFNAGSGDGNVETGSTGGGSVHLMHLAGSLGPLTGTALPVSVSSAALWTYGQNVYFGSGGQNGLTSTAIYGASLDASGNWASPWTYKGDLPWYVGQSMATRWADRLYIGGGWNSASVQSDNLTMSVLDSQGLPTGWVSIGTLPQQESEGRLVAAEGKLFYFGSNNPCCYASQYVYEAPIRGDGTLGPWTALSNRPSGMRDFYLSYIANTFFLIGGETATWAGELTYIKAPLSDSGVLGAWSSGSPNLPTPRSYGGGTEMDGAGKVYVVGGKRYLPPDTLYSTIYSAPIDAAGSMGAWTLESPSLPTPTAMGLIFIQDGRLFQLGGNRSTGTAWNSVFSASLNQGSANAPVGNFVGRFDLGSAQSLGTLEWSGSDLNHVALQARVADGSGVFGAWTALSNSGVINLYSVAATGRYVEYRAKLTDGGAGDVELYSVTLRDLADLSATPTPTQTQTPTPSPTCPALPSYSGPGSIGDIFLTMQAGSTQVLRMDSASGGGFHSFADLADTHIEDIAVDYDDNSKLRVSRQDHSDIVEVDSNGNIVAGQTWSLPAGSSPRLGAFDPLNGDFYVPDGANYGIWWVKHGTTTPVMLPGSNLGYHGPIACVFDNSGNLYIADSINQTVWKYGAAALAAWSSSSVTPSSSIYASIGHELCGMAYDGNGHLYVTAVDLSNQCLFYTVTMGPTSGSLSSMQPVWPALGGVPGGLVGQRLGSSYDVVIDLSGKLWIVCNDVSNAMHGLAQLDSNGTVLDWRSTASQTGGPGAIALAGLRLPHGYTYPGCQPTSTPTPSLTPSASPTATRTPLPTPACPPAPDASFSGAGDLIFHTNTSTGFRFNPFTLTWHYFDSTPSNNVFSWSSLPDDPSKQVIDFNGPSSQNVQVVSSTGSLSPLTGDANYSTRQGAFQPDTKEYWVMADSNTILCFHYPAYATHSVYALTCGGTPCTGNGELAFDRNGNLYFTEGPRVREISQAALLSATASVDSSILATLPGGGLLGNGLVCDDQYVYVNDFHSVNHNTIDKIALSNGAASTLTSTLDPAYTAGSGNNAFGQSAVLTIGLDGYLWTYQDCVTPAYSGLAQIDRTTGAVLQVVPVPAMVDGYPVGTVTLAGLLGVVLPGKSVGCAPSSPTPTQTPTPSPTLTPAPTSGCGLSVGSYSGIGKAGDILVSLRLGGGVVAGLDSNPNGAYYNYASISDAHLDGLTTDYDDNSRVRASREDNHDVVELDASGNIVAGQTWTFPSGVTPKISAFNPVTGDFYVPDQAGNGIWVVKHGTTSPQVLPSSASYFTQPLCATFDNSGNLYIADTLGQKVWKYSAASLAAWSASSTTPVPTLYVNLGVNIGGLVYDGGNHLYGVAAAPTALLVDILMGASSGTASGTYLSWPALPNIPPAKVGQHPTSPDGLVMDLNGNLWAVEADATMPGVYKMDIHGTILDWRPLSIAGTPDDLAIAGLRLPHGPISCLSYTPSPSPSPSPSATPSSSPSATPSATPAASFAGPGACPVTPSVSLPFSGIGTPGDILISAIQSTHIFGFDPVSETYYSHSTVPANIDGGLAVDPSDPTKLRIVQGSGLTSNGANGANLGTWGSSVASGLLYGAFAPDGSYWVTDQAAARLFRFPVGGGTGQGKYFSTGSNAPTGVAFDSAGNLYVTDAINARVLKVAAAAQAAVTMTASVLCTGVPNGGAIAYDGDHSLYFGIDPSAGIGKLCKVDTGSGALSIIDTSFAPLSENGGGPLYNPSSVVFGLDGALWLGLNESANLHGLLKMDSNGTPLKFYPYPASIGGVSTTNLTVGGLAVLGLAGVRNCGGSLTGTPTASPTPSATASFSPTASPTPTPTASCTVTVLSTATDTATPSRTVTATFSSTVTPSATATPSWSMTASATVTGSGLTPFSTSTPTLSPTRTPTQTPGAPSRTVTPLPSHTCIIVPAKTPGPGPQKVIVCSQDGGHCSVKVYRPEGRICNRLWEGEMNPNETKVLFWNCDDDDGQDVASGIYIVLFRDGNGSLHKSKCAIIR